MATTFKNADLFSTPIRQGKVRNGVYWNKYPNGVINIDGVQYSFYTIAEAIKKYRRDYPVVTTKKMQVESIYYYLPLDSFNQPTGDVQEIALRKCDYILNKRNGKYIYDNYYDALRRAQA
jgi:hypothetical protein